jgi:hypothetical protein
MIRSKSVCKFLFSVATIPTLVTILVLSFTPSLFSSISSYASAQSKFDFSGVPDIIIETKEPDNQYRVNPDYISFFDDVTGDEVIKNTKASDAKNLVIEGGSTVTLYFDCEGEGCSFVEDLTIYLVSVNVNDKDIASPGEDPERIDIANIDCTLVNYCAEPSNITFPDIDSGKYKLVIDRDEDEAHFFYINKISIV